MLTRVSQLRPFVLQETMVPAAGFSPEAMVAMERFLRDGRQELRALIRRYIDWLRGPGRTSDAAEQQRRFVRIRLRFNQIVTQFDLFSDAVTQRSERDTGVLLSGLDVAARDGLRLPSGLVAPPVVCYLDRGPGAAIRRARTRLPGGARMPISVVRVPRERMIGYGVASSLYHEVGHQAAALLDAVPSLVPALRGRRREMRGEQAMAWRLFERWISEIFADMWSVGHVGLTSTLGLLAVVSLPRRFVFLLPADDPHPSPYVRVLISAAIGARLHHHPQWQRVASRWRAMYPRDGIDADAARIFAALEREVPALVDELLAHRPPRLGRPLRDVLPLHGVSPDHLLAQWERWGRDLDRVSRVRPSRAFAVVGQATANGRLTPESESRLLTVTLRRWAVRSTLAPAAIEPRAGPPSAGGAHRPPSRRPASARPAIAHARS